MSRDIAYPLLVRARGAIELLRSGPFDTSTTEGRTKERDRRIARTMVASLSARSVVILTTIVSVPFTIHYLGSERYGMWMTISALLAMFSFADLGMGNGLMNAVSEANGRGDSDKAREYVSSALVVMLALTVGLAAGFAAIYALVPWPRLFNVTSPTAVSEAGPATAVFLGCFLLNIPLGVVERVQLGYQDGFANSLWLGAGNVLALGALLVTIHLGAGLPWLVLAMAGTPVLTRLANGVVLFGFQRPWLRPSLSATNRAAGRRVLQIGVLFLVLQIAMAVSYQSDSIVVAQVIGPKAVAEYSVAYRLFTLAPMVIGFGLAPLWPAYGEALARGDLAWVRRTLVKSLRLSVLLTAPLSLLLVIFGSRIVALWAGPEVEPSFMLLLGFGVWMVMGTAGNAIAMFLNGANIVRFQVVLAVAMASLNICLSILLAGRMGVAGVIWGTVIAYACCAGLPMAAYVPSLLRRMGMTADKQNNRRAVSAEVTI